MSLLDEDDGVTRREMLTISGVAAFAVGTLTADGDEAGMMPVVGGGVDVDTSNYLRIGPNSTVRIAGNEIRSVDGIDWGAAGTLELESGGLIEIADTA